MHTIEITCNRAGEVQILGERETDTGTFPAEVWATTLALDQGARVTILLRRDSQAGPGHNLTITAAGMTYALTGDTLTTLSTTVSGPHVGLIVGLAWAPALVLEEGEHWDRHDDSKLRVLIDQTQGPYDPRRFGLDGATTTQDKKRAKGGEERKEATSVKRLRTHMKLCLLCYHKETTLTALLGHIRETH